MQDSIYLLLITISPLILILLSIGILNKITKKDIEELETEVKK